MDGEDSRSRFEVQFARQGRAAVVKHLQHGRMILPRLMQPHESDVSLLPQGIPLDQLRRVLNRLGDRLLLGEQLDQPLEAPEVGIPEAGALGLQPRLVTVGVEVPVIEAYGPLQVFECVREGALLLSLARVLQVGLELGDVQGNHGSVPPANFLGIDVQESILVGEGVPEIVQHMAEVGPGLPFGGVRPEKEGKSLPPLGRIPVEQKVNEQRLRPGASHALHRLPSGREAETAEQADVEQRLDFCGVHRLPLCQFFYI